MTQGESILSIEEVVEVDVIVDGPAPLSQAAELASKTPGMAAAPLPGSNEDQDRG